MSIQFRPLADRILVQRAQSAPQSKGGILIPELAQETLNEGVVLAVGPGKVTPDGKRLEPRVKVGDTVLFGKYSGTEIKLDDQMCIVMVEDDVMGIVEAL
jgi:chaperonin GroES